MAWQRVGLVVEGTQAEALAEALEAAGALATEICDADAGTAGESPVFGEPGADAGLWPRCRVSALFGADAALDHVVSGALESAGVDALGSASVERVEDADWVSLTQRQFEPIRAGRKLWIVPTWHQPPEPGATNVVLDPGAAFGTGSHPTTRLCLAWLEDQVAGGEIVLDYGCGSGILAIAAMKLGAARAIGIDVDPLAHDAARYNADCNNVAVEIGDASTASGTEADITVANILANPLRMLAPLLTARTRPGGRMALSGILADQAGDVIAAYAPGARLAIAGRDAGWVLLAGERVAPC